MFVARAERGLDFRCAADRLDGAVEFREQRIPCRVEDPSPMQFDQRFEDFSVAAKHANGSFLALGHHLAVAGNIRAQNRGEPPFEILRAFRDGFVWHLRFTRHPNLGFECETSLFYGRKIRKDSRLVKANVSGWTHPVGLFQNDGR